MAISGFSLIEMLFVLAIMGIMAGIAVPSLSNELGYLRVSGDARSIANGVALTKMRAAAKFTQARLYVNTSSNYFRIETWQKTGTADWVADGGNTYLSTGVTFGFGSVATPPPNSQATIGLAPACYSKTGAAIANTACIVFNSRGTPIAQAAAPTGTEGPIATDAMYVTNSTNVYGVTVSATGAIRIFTTKAAATPSWTQE